MHISFSYEEMVVPSRDLMSPLLRLLFWWFEDATYNAEVSYLALWVVRGWLKTSGAGVVGGVGSYCPLLAQLSNRGRNRLATYNPRLLLLSWKSWGCGLSSLSGPVSGIVRVVWDLMAVICSILSGSAFIISAESAVLTSAGGSSLVKPSHWLSSVRTISVVVAWGANVLHRFHPVTVLGGVSWSFW